MVTYTYKARVDTMKTLTLTAIILFPLFVFPQVDEPIADLWNSESHRQFDFWVGAWDVNLRIQQPTGEWKDQVQSTAHIYQILDGKAVLELWNENKINEGIKGYSLRYFNEDLGKWELWLNWPGQNMSGSSTLDGSFRHGRGEFFSEFPKNDSVTITQRYTFCDITPTSLRWDNAFSEDGGKTWKEGNWIMEFSRKANLAPKLSHNEAVNTYDNGLRCDSDEFKFFADWKGNWKGNIELFNDGKGDKLNGQLDIFPVLDGCAIMVFMTHESEKGVVKSFSLNTYNTYASKFEEGVLTNQKDDNFNIRYGEMIGNSLTMIDKEKSSKSVWKKEKNRLSWDFYKMINNQWVRHKSLTVKR